METAKFAIGDKVIISLLEVEAHVTGIFLGQNGLFRYELEWLRNDGGVSEQWFDEVRLSKVD